MKTIFFILSTCSLVAVAAPPAAPVFTGTLSHDRLGLVQLARLSLLTYVRPGGNPGNAETHHSAILSLHLGNFTGPEHVSLYFDNVTLNPQTRQYLFLAPPSSDPNGKLPTVSLRFVDADTLEGDYLSPTAGRIGRLRLRRGLAASDAATATNVMTPLAGHYSGDCSYGQDGSKFVSLLVAPSRLPSSAPLGPETALSTVNYLASAACNFSSTGGPLGCGSLETGYLDIYRNEVRFVDASRAAWSCRRIGTDGLNCNGPFISGCSLQREAAPPTITAADTRPVSLEPGSTPAPAAVNPCGAWDGRYRGILRHQATGREQYLDLELSTLLIQGPQPPVKCALLGNAELVFGDEADGRERLNFNLPHFEFIPNRPEQIVFGDSEADAILQISQTSAGKIEGNWYSKFYGFVGSFTAVTDFRGRAENVVPAIGGTYTLERENGWTLDFSTIAGVSVRNNRNPFHQLQVSGWENPGFTRIPIETVSYDYVANHLVYPTRGRFSAGPVTRDGLRLQSLLRTYLGVPGGEFNFRRR